MAVTTKNQLHHGGTETRREAFGIKRKSNTNPQDGEEPDEHGEEEAAKICAKKEQLEISSTERTFWERKTKANAKPRTRRTGGEQGQENVLKNFLFKKITSLLAPTLGIWKRGRKHFFQFFRFFDQHVGSRVHKRMRGETVVHANAVGSGISGGENVNIGITDDHCLLRLRAGFL
jgi:hypothetical protein